MDEGVLLQPSSHPADCTDLTEDTNRRFDFSTLTVSDAFGGWHLFQS